MVIISAPDAQRQCDSYCCLLDYTTVTGPELTLYDNNIRIEGSQGNQEERVRFKYEEANWGKFKTDADLIDWVGC